MFIEDAIDVERSDMEEGCGLCFTLDDLEEEKKDELDEESLLVPGGAIFRVEDESHTSSEIVSEEAQPHPMQDTRVGPSSSTPPLFSSRDR